MHVGLSEKPLQSTLVDNIWRTNYQGKHNLRSVQKWKTGSEETNHRWYEYRLHDNETIAARFRRYRLVLLGISICIPLRERSDDGWLYIPPFYRLCRNKKVHILFAYLKTPSEDSGDAPRRVAPILILSIRRSWLSTYFPPAKMKISRVLSLQGAKIRSIPMKAMSCRFYATSCEELVYKVIQKGNLFENCFLDLLQKLIGGNLKTVSNRHSIFICRIIYFLHIICNLLKPNIFTCFDA